MLVANVVGYDFSFKYKGSEGEGVIKIPFDHKPYKVPDDIPQFKELKQVVIVDAPVDNGGNVQSVNTESNSYASDYQNFPKTDLEKEQDKADAEKAEAKEHTKPLSGKKIKKSRKQQILSKKIKKE